MSLWPVRLLKPMGFLCTYSVQWAVGSIGGGLDHQGVRTNCTSNKTWQTDNIQSSEQLTETTHRSG